jgi:hypothetical protein
MYSDTSFINGDTSAFLVEVLFFINHQSWMIRAAGGGLPDGRHARSDLRRAAAPENVNSGAPSAQPEPRMVR